MARLLRAWVRPLVAVAVLAGGAAGLCGCSDESEPSVSVTPTVTDGGVLSPSPSPSPTVLPELTEQELLELLPEDTRIPSLPSAEAFVRFVLTQYVLVYQTGDTRVWEALSLPECGFCASTIQGASDLISTGGHREGGQLVAVVGSETGYVDGDVAVVQLDVEQSDTTDVGPDGSVLGVGPAATALMTVELHFEAERQVWLIAGINTEAK